jgi:hypothetical protein
MIKSRRMRLAWHVARMMRIGMHVGYWWESEKGKGPLGRPRWITLKMDLRETEWDGIDWIELDQDRDQWRALMNTVTNRRVP